ncbi:hypothetical protein MKX01_017285 [Papaver californicum]|nr:hypothetical protein MKX01_017285 [Papaver californicum]
MRFLSNLSLVINYNDHFKQVLFVIDFIASSINASSSINRFVYHYAFAMLLGSTSFVTFSRMWGLSLFLGR